MKSTIMYLVWIAYFLIFTALIVTCVLMGASSSSLTAIAIAAVGLAICLGIVTDMVGQPERKSEYRED